jgi:hypothetical protein
MKRALLLLAWVIAAPAPLRGEAPADVDLAGGPVADEVIERLRGAMVGVTLHNEQAATKLEFSATPVNGKGWLVLPAKAVAYKQAPAFHGSDGAELPFVKVLAVDWKLSLAVVETGGKPALHLSPAPRPVQAGERVALLRSNSGGKPLAARHGAVLAFRQEFSSGPSSPSRLSVGVPHRDTLFGSALINGRGELAGIAAAHAPDHGGLQPLLACRSDQIAALIEKASAHPDGLPFPLEKDNPFDQAYWEYSFSRFNLERTAQPADLAKQDADLQIAFVRDLLRKHPESRLVKQVLLRLEWNAKLADYQAKLAEDSLNGVTPSQLDLNTRTNALLDEISAVTKAIRIDRKDSQGLAFGIVAAACQLNGNHGKIVELCKEELDAWGDSPPGLVLAVLAGATAGAGRDQEAVKLFEQSIERAPDLMFVLNAYRTYLIKHGEPAKIQELDERIWHLESVFRPQP